MKLDALISDFSSKCAVKALTSVVKASAREEAVTDWLKLTPEGLNAVFGDGEKGLPMGRLVTLYSPESHGKTALLLYLIGLCQKDDGVGVFVPVEGSYDPAWARMLGVNTDELLITNLGFRPILKKKTKAELAKERTKNPDPYKIAGYTPEAMEDLFQKFELLLESKRTLMPEKKMIIGWDSVTMTPPRAELEGDYDDTTMALQARALSKGLRRLHPLLMQCNTTLICILQTRMKIGGFTFEAPAEVRSMAFYTSVKVKLNRVSTQDMVKKNKQFVIKAQNKKNKLSEPYMESRFILDFHKGILPEK